MSPEATLDRAIERCPVARGLMRAAVRESPVYATSDRRTDRHSKTDGDPSF
jgi:hypothetical protein